MQKGNCGCSKWGDSPGDDDGCDVDQTKTGRKMAQHGHSLESFAPTAEAIEIIQRPISPDVRVVVVKVFTGTKVAESVMAKLSTRPENLVTVGRIQYHSVLLGKEETLPNFEPAGLGNMHYEGRYGWFCRKRQKFDRHCLYWSDAQAIARDAAGLCGYMFTWNFDPNCR